MLSPTRLTAHLSALLVAFAILLAASPARSEPSMNLKVDWLQVAKLATQKAGMWRDGKESAVLYRQYGPLAETANESYVANPALSGTQRGNDLAVAQPATSTPWFGTAPNVSLVARDWGSAKAIAGGDVALTDALRTSRSYRMALTRVRFGTGRFVPFIQLGLGQYRVDHDVVAQTMQDTELATQVGGGFEIHVVKSRYFAFDLAEENCFTQLVRDTREVQNVKMPRMWSSLLAMRFRF